MDGPTVELWNDLRRVVPDTLGSFAAHELRVDGRRCGLFMAIGTDLGLHLFIPVEGSSDPALPLRLRGMEVHERKVVLGDAPARLYLDLSTTPAYEAMFTTVAREVAHAVAVEGREPRSATLRTIRRWQTFWRGPGTKELTRSQQIGLFGEVWWLNRVLLPLLGPEVVYRWTGPHGERHDFQSPDLHLEVKVTERSEAVFRVSGLDQLESPAGRTLLLATLMVREESTSPYGLVQEVSACEQRLAPHVAELEAFRDRLAAVGYRREAEPHWDRLRLRVRAADLYLVDDTFPRLTEARLVGGCPPGVSDVVYNIDLATTTPLDEHGRERFLRRILSL